MSVNDDTTGAPNDGSPFPAIRETPVGAGLVQTADARELHRFLAVRRDFSTWVKERLDRYGFVENVDYVSFENLSSPNPGSAKARSQVRTEYALTLDTAKEIAMVENTKQGRAVRRYFIECERRVKAEALDGRRVGGITKGVVMKAITDMVPDIVRVAVLAILDEKRAGPTLDFSETVSAYQMIEMAGIDAADRQRGTAQMVTNRMLAFCAKRQVACLRTPGYVNPAEPYRFPHGLASEWLMGPTSGVQLIRNQIERAKARKARSGRATGQAALALVPPAQPSA